MTNYKWMNDVLQMNLIGAYGIMLALAARLFLKRIGSRFSYCLWIIVFMNLLLPTVVTGSFSLIPPQLSEAEVTENNVFSVASVPEGYVMTPIEEEREPVVVYYTQKQQTISAGAQAQGLTREQLLVGVWILGIVVMLVLEVMQFWRMKRRIAGAEAVATDSENRIVTLRGITTPFLFGFCKPVIYLPHDLGEEERGYVLRHELYHRRRRDYLVKAAALCICILYWYNPIVWAGFYFFCVDMELSCDEAVVMGEAVDVRKAYSACLLKYGALQNRYVLSTLTFGEPGLKMRIKNVLKFKKRGIVITVAAVLCIAVLAVGLWIRPKQEAGEVPESQVAEEQQSPEEPKTTEEPEASGEQNTEGEETGENHEQAEELSALTIEKLMELLENGEIADYDYRKCTNGIVRDDMAISLTYSVQFNLHYGEQSLTLDANYWKKDETLNTLGLRAQNKEYLMLYRDKQIYATEEGLETFLKHRTSVADYITAMELPEGYDMGEYDATVGYGGGALIAPVAYEHCDRETVPSYWYYAGFFSVMPSETGMLYWDGDVLSGVVIWDNHTGTESVGALEGLEKPAYMLRVNHDLYTAAGMAELEEQGVDLETAELTSDYWYIVFGDKDSGDGYCLALTTKFFSMEEAVEIAKTVQFVNK